MQLPMSFLRNPVAAAVSLSIFTSLSFSTYAQEDPVQELATTKVESENSEVEVKTLGPLDLRTSTRSDLSEALSIIPSLRIDNTASSSTRQGDIKPAEFSIRGAAPYQNNIQLDNSSIDSLLDPAKVLRPGESPGYSQVSGHSQSIFIDPEFLSSIEVIDSNASAKEGGFTGGVIKAKTRGYQGENTFSVSHRMTKDSWTEFHIDKAQLANFEEGAAQLPTGTPGKFQPNFDKSETSLSGTFRAGDIGFFVGYSEKRSEITQKRTSELATMSDFEYFLETGNVFKRGDEDKLDSESRYFTVRADALNVPYDLYATFSYSDFSEDSFLVNFFNSDFASEVRGYNFSVNYGDDFGATRVDSTVALNLSDNSRDAQINTFDKYIGRSIYTENAYIGNFGDLENEQERLSASLDFDTELNGNHNLLYGLEIDHVRLRQSRSEDYVYTEYAPTDRTLISGVPYAEHHVYREAVYGAGDIGFNETNFSAYGEIKGESESLFYSGGLRASRDAWLGNTNLAPRLSGGMYLADDESLSVEVGANRYYGKSFLSYRLRDEEKKFVTVREREETYNPDSPFNEFSGEDKWLPSDLNTPYDDEYSIGLSSSQFSGIAKIEFVVRKGRDQIRTDYNSEDDTYQYVNSGESDTRQIDVSWRSPTYNWLSSDWRVNAGVSWMDTETDAQYLDGGYGKATNPDEEIIFDGKRMMRVDLPADDYASPISANIDVIMQAFDNRLSMTNSFGYTNGYQYLSSAGTDEATGLKNYETVDQGTTFNWNLGVEYQLFAGNNSPYVSLDVINLTDKSNVLRYEQGTQLFSLGRQFWVEVGYRF